MSAKHTPGPWKYWGKLSGSENSNGFSITDADLYWIADVSPRDSDGIAGESNARLIAAAPELLESLAELVARFGTRAKDRVDMAIITDAEKAIAKATGEGA